MGHKLNINQQYALVAKKPIAYWVTLTGVTLANQGKLFFYSVLHQGGLMWSTVSSFGPQIKKHINRLERFQPRAVKMFRGLGNITYEESLK